MFASQNVSQVLQLQEEIIDEIFKCESSGDGYEKKKKRKTEKMGEREEERRIVTRG